MSGCRVIINIQFSFIRAEFRIPLPDNCGTTIVYHHHSADVLQTKIQLTKQRNPNDIVVRITLPVIPDASPPGGLVLVVWVVLVVAVDSVYSVVVFGLVVVFGSVVGLSSVVVFCSVVGLSSMVGLGSVVVFGSVVDSGSTVVSQNPVMFEQTYKTVRENEIGYANTILYTYCA